MKEVELEVRHEGDKCGWRMIDKSKGNSPDRFKNPDVEKNDTVQWQAPKDYGISIIILEDSPFERKGQKVTNEVIPVPAGHKSEKLHIATATGGLSEYGAMVATGNGDYTYVRGEMSPPGVIVKP